MATEIDKIQQHYNTISQYYQSLWGDHIHHGYFENGNETVAEATQKLIDLLLEKIDVKPGNHVLDIGCGLGGSARYMAKKFGCKVTGITISEEQVRLAREASAEMKNKPEFLLQDANDLDWSTEFDLIWSVEMIAHLQDRKMFFKRVKKAMKKEGRWCIAAWIKDRKITPGRQNKYINSIEKGMIVDLPTQQEYLQHISDNNLTLVYYEDISKKVAQTWDITLDMIKKPDIWKLARDLGSDFINFLTSFLAMKKGYETGHLNYVVMVLQK